VVIIFNLLFSFAALVCFVAIIKPYGPFATRGRAFLCFLGFVFLNGLVTVTASQKPSKENNKAESKPVISAPEASPVEIPSSNWIYSTHTDEMTNVESKVACTTSLNELAFNFPYGGGSSGKLCFRQKAKSLDAWVSISSGQFLCGIEDCSLKLKFDDGAVQRFHAVESSTHESNMLFIEPETRLLNAVKKAKQLKLQAEYYQEGSQVLTFNLSDLDASKL
jgi:hypothetical protein